MNKIDSKDQAILDTAAKHFAINGFGSARMDEIAEEAKVNKATIYYRIGGACDLVTNQINLVNLRDFIRAVAAACTEKHGTPNGELAEIIASLELGE